MLLLLLSLFTNYALTQYVQAEQADSSKIPLSEHIHKSVHEIDALLRDFQLEIRKEKNVLRSVDLEVKDIGLLDYSITPVWWGGSRQTDLTGMNTTITPFPIPEGHFTESTKDAWEKLNLPGIEPNYSFTEPLEGVRGHLPDFGHHLDPTPPPFNPYLTSDASETPFIPYYDKSSTSFTRPSYPFFVPPRTPVSAPEPYINYISFVANYSPGSPTFRLPTKSLLALPALRGKATVKQEVEGVTMSHLYMKVMGDQAGNRPGGKLLTKANRIKSTTAQRSSKLKRTLSKAQAWVRNRQWMKTGKPGRTGQANIREASKKPVENSPAEGKLADVEKSPMEKALDVAEGSPGLDGNYTANSTLSLQTFADFSTPGLTDILPSMSIPGLEEVARTTASELDVTARAPTTTNILSIEITEIKPAVSHELFQEDKHGFLFVTLPATIVAPRTTLHNTVGDIMVNAENFTADTLPTPSVQGYHEMMERLDEGYLTVFFLELSRLIANKRPEDVSAVMGNAETLYNKLYEQNSLSFFGEHILELGRTVSQLFSGSEVDVLQSNAKMMNQMLSGRSEFLSVEVNSIIDYADLLYDDEEGEALFDALNTFKDFPNVDSSSRDTCLTLIENFLRPYRRLRSTDRLLKLTDSISNVVIKKFGSRRSSGVATSHPIPIRKNNKHMPHSLRHRLGTIRHRKNRPRQQQGNRYHRRQVYAARPMLRSMLPITKHQTRFKVITPRQLRSNGYLSMVRPTMDYFKKRLGKPVHPPSGVLQLFPQAKYVEFRRQAQPSEQDKHHLGEPANQMTLGTLKDEVRRIVEESSYSDEEASLKMNLHHALRVNWHKTSTQ